MKICKYRQRGDLGSTCSLGISPMKCAMCSSFAYPSAQDRHRADVGVIEAPQRFAEKEPGTHVSTVLEAEILAQGQIKGGCGCKKG